MDLKTKLFLSLLLEEDEVGTPTPTKASYADLKVTTSGVSPIGSVSFKTPKEYIDTVNGLDLNKLEDSINFTKSVLYPLYVIAGNVGGAYTSLSEEYNAITAETKPPFPTQDAFKNLFSDSGIDLRFNKKDLGGIIGEIGDFYKDKVGANPAADFEKLKNQFITFYSDKINDQKIKQQFQKLLLTKISNIILSSKDGLRSNSGTIKAYRDKISIFFTEAPTPNTTNSTSDQTATATDPETGATSLIHDGTAKFITMLEFLQARKEQEARLTNSVKDNPEELTRLNTQKAQTTSFISSIYKKFQSFLSGIFADKTDLNNKIKEKQATKTFLNSAKDRIYNPEDKVEEQIGSWTQKEFSDAVDVFFNDYASYRAIIGELNSITKEQLQNIAKNILEYYKSNGNSDIVTGIKIKDLRLADTPEQQQELVNDISSEEQGQENPEQPEREITPISTAEDLVYIVELAKLVVSPLQNNKSDRDKNKSLLSKLIDAFKPIRFSATESGLGSFKLQNKELNDLLKDNGFTVDSYFDYNKDFIRNLIQKSEENPNLMRQINLNLSVINDLILDLGKQLQEENPSFSIEQAERLASTNAEELIRSLNTANETINLKDNSSRTSKLIVESITKGKTIKIKGTKEQINLFNKLIKEELSIIQKIKNKKPYVVPTKDIELFEKLTGIKWPFKEEG